MKYFIAFMLLLCLTFPVLAQDDNAESHGSTSLGVRLLYHYLPAYADDSILLNILFLTRMGIDFTFLGNISDSQSLGGEILLDMDILSFLTSQSDGYNGLGIFEVGARILYSYRTRALLFTPLAGIRYTTFLFLTGGCNLEGGLKLAVPIKKEYNLEAEATYTFYGFGDTFYDRHLTFALALNYYL